MKKRMTARMSAVMAAAVVCMSGVSCGNKEGTKSEVTADQIISNSYKATDFDVEFDKDADLDSAYTLGGDRVLLSASCYSEDKYERKYYITDSSFSEMKQVDINCPESTEDKEYNICVAPGTDGKFYVAIVLTDHEGKTMDDFEQKDGSFDYEAYMMAAKVSITIYTYDSEGKQVSEKEVTGLYEDGEEANQLYSMYYAGDKFILCLGGMDGQRYAIVNSEGEYQGELDISDETWIQSINMTSDGRLCCSYWDEGMKLSFIDPDTLELGEMLDLKESDFGELMMGGGDYLLYANSHLGLVGIKEDGTAEEVVNWLDSDIDPDKVRCVIPVDGGEFVIFCQDWESGESTFSRLSKRDSSEMKEQKVITVAVQWADNSITAKVNDFNKSNTDYRIKLVDYSKYEDYDYENEKINNSADKQLKLDIVSGNAPDMIVGSNNLSAIPQLASKGVYTDLYKFLDEDKELSRDDIMPNILEAGEYDGKLLSLSASFTVNTFAVKSKLWDKDSWTVDELIDTYKSMPEGTSFTGWDTKQSVLGVFMGSITDYMDVKNAECHFDSPEFIKILEFCNTFPDETEEDDSAIAYDAEVPSDDYEYSYRKDKTMLYEFMWSDLREYQSVEQGTFGEPVNLIGCPASDGNGAYIEPYTTFAILESSPSKQACWDFLKMFFTEEYQESYRVWGFPSYIPSFEKKADMAMQKNFYMDENNKKIEYDDTYWLGDKEYTIELMKKEKRDELVEYIKGISKVPYYSDEPMNILMEEVEAYFKGEKSAQETASMLQDRISVLLSEQQ